MSAHAGGMCMSQCKHWRIPLFLFPVSRKGKRNASESLRLHQSKNPVDEVGRIFALYSSSLSFQSSFFSISRQDFLTYDASVCPAPGEEITIDQYKRLICLSHHAMLSRVQIPLSKTRIHLFRIRLTNNRQALGLSVVWQRRSFIRFARFYGRE